MRVRQQDSNILFKIIIFSVAVTAVLPISFEFVFEDSDLVNVYALSIVFFLYCSMFFSFIAYYRVLRMSLGNLVILFLVDYVLFFLVLIIFVKSESGAIALFMFIPFFVSFSYLACQKNGKSD